MLWVEKGWADHRKEASNKDCDRDGQKQRGRRKERKTSVSETTGMEEEEDQKGKYLSFRSKLVLTLH